jgi:DNA-binding NtrC family response regulator
VIAASAASAETYARPVPTHACYLVCPIVYDPAMALARLVVIEGPDLGQEFEIPLRGGGIGRGEGNVVQLSDLAVSRAHCAIELREGRLCLVDEASRNKTTVNGQPVRVHVLQQGDEIAVGKTRLAFLPAEGAQVSARHAMPSRVTMEIGSGEILRAAQTLGLASGPDERARRYLASIAALGEALRGAADREALGRSTCQAVLAALHADRVFMCTRDAGGRMSPSAAAVAPDDPDGVQLALPREALEKVAAQGKAIALDHGGGARSALAAPLLDGDGNLGGILWADRRGAMWDQIDLYAHGSLAFLVAAALAGFASREALVRENRDLADRLGDTREMVGSSQTMRSLMAFVLKVGPSDATVLLTGESGAGKEMVARATHRASRRKNGPFIAVNCAALTQTLIESELFGHEKGAFTGATEKKLGRFELATEGTLFLDEVGELPLDCQTKFLRVLEEQVFERVGGTKPISVDVRVVAATNRDLGEMVRRGQFREDLYYRLSVIHTVVPSLRERPEDIPELANFFLHRLRGSAGRRVTGFAPDALRALAAHTWPGNVRELKNAVERAIVLGEGELVRLEDLPPLVSAAGGARTPTAPFNVASLPPLPGAPSHGPGMPALTPPAGAIPHIPRSLRELEREGIIAALRATNGNKAQAAQILEIDRSTLYKKIKEYDIES